MTVKHLAPTDIPPLDPGLVNVTAPDAHGFEFLPHGQTFKRPIDVLLPMMKMVDPSAVRTSIIPTEAYSLMNTFAASTLTVGQLPQKQFDLSLQAMIRYPRLRDKVSANLSLLVLA